MAHTTNSKPKGVAHDKHTYNLLLLLFKLKVLGALFDARPINFKVFIDDGTSWVAEAEL